MVYITKLLLGVICPALREGQLVTGIRIFKCIEKWSEAVYLILNILYIWNNIEINQLVELREETKDQIYIFDYETIM